MKNLNFLSNQSDFDLENGSGMTREWLGIDSTVSRKLFTLLFVLLLGFSQMWGTEANFSPTGAHTTEGDWSLTDGDITISWHGTDLSTDIRVYKGKTLTVTSSSGNITAISFTFSGSNNGGWSTSYTGLSTTEWSRTTSSGKSGKQAQITAMTVTYDGGSSKTLSSIAITTQPNTRKYLVGDSFSKTGAVVRATYSDNSTADVSSSATWTPSGALTAGTSKTMTASYTESSTTKTATTTVDVYSVTVQKQDETGATITADGVSASISGRTLSASATAASKYVFKGWKYGTAAGTSIASAGSANTTLNGTPTGNVTIIAEFYAPLTATWMVAGSEWTGKGEQTTFARGSHVSALPTAPNPNNSEGCGDKFVGWTTVEEYAHGSSPLYTSASQIPNATTDQVFYAVFADYDE